MIDNAEHMSWFSRLKWKIRNTWNLFFGGWWR